MQITYKPGSVGGESPLIDINNVVDSNGSLAGGNVLFKLYNSTTVHDAGHLVGSVLFSNIAIGPGADIDAYIPLANLVIV